MNNIIINKIYRNKKIRGTCILVLTIFLLNSDKISDNCNGNINLDESIYFILSYPLKKVNNHENIFKDITAIFFGEEELSSSNNAFHLIYFEENESGLFGQFEQGYWDRRKGIYTADLTTGFTPILNLSWTVFLPLKDYTEWEEFTINQNDALKGQSSIKNYNISLGNIYFKEITEYYSGEKVERRFLIDNGILDLFQYSINNSEPFMIWRIYKSEFWMYKETESIPPYIYLLGGVVLIVSIIIILNFPRVIKRFFKDEAN